MTREGRLAQAFIDLADTLVQDFEIVDFLHMLCERCVLALAGMSLANIVRLNIYTTDVDDLLANYTLLAERLGAAGVAPPGTLLGVGRLAYPELLVEIEVTAVA